MPPREPGWWYEPAGALSGALAPLGYAYGAVAARRMARPPSYSSRLPVICVGNLTLGGTGKTPLSLRLGALAGERGVATAFLTRGYGGRRRGPHWVSPSDTAADIGDEALLLARLGPAMVARDRVAGARAIEADGRAGLIVMDDGLQNPALAKRLTIAVVDGVRGIGNGAVFPAGPLRAPLEAQLARVDAIVVNTAPGAGPSAVGGWLRQRFPGPVMSAVPVPSGDLGAHAGRAVVAYAGIGHPARFPAMLRHAGVTVEAFEAFPDHHAFTEVDARRLIVRAGGGPLLTTEKDWVRLAGATGARAELRAASTAIAMQLAFEARDEERLRSLIDAALAGARAR